MNITQMMDLKELTKTNNCFRLYSNIGDDKNVRRFKNKKKGAFEDKVYLINVE